MMTSQGPISTTLCSSREGEMPQKEGSSSWQSSLGSVLVEWREVGLAGE